MNSSYDIIIIGAGPAGLSSAIEAQKAGFSHLILDKGGIVHSIGRYQREMFFFSTPELLEIGGLPFVVPTTRPTSLDCANYYRRVADHFHLTCCFFERVISVARTNGRFIVTTSKSRSLSARFVVAATGYYDTPSPLNVPGENLPHVSHYYNDPIPYYGQAVTIVGGKNSAVEAALDLWRHGARVTLVHRGKALSSGVKYWILPDFENRVTDRAITTHFGSTVNQFFEGKTAIQTPDGEVILETDFAFVLIGYRPDAPFLQKLGIEIDQDSIAPSHDPETMETNISGLFVAGGLVGGRFNNKVFIENGRRHGKLIVDSIRRRL